MLSCYYTMMNRAAFIEKLTEIQRTVEQLLIQLKTSEHDAFAAHLYQSRREYRSACDHSGKSGKQIERCLISTFQGRREHGLQGRLSVVGALAADRRLIAIMLSCHPF